MTVSTDTSTARYEGNGVTNTFAFNGRIFTTSDLAVDIITRATDALVETLTLADYTVAINGAESASVIVDAGKIPSGTQDILIRRNIPFTQSLRLPTGTVFPASDVENGLDKLTILTQAMSSDLGRAIKLPVTSSLTDVELPTPVSSQLLGWNATADNLQTYSFAVITTEIDTIFSGLASGDFIQYNGAKWINVPKSNLPVDGIKATSSAGLALKNNSAVTVLTVGAGAGTGATFAGGVNASGGITATGYVNISGTSSSPAYITFAEDTDNGTNKVTVIAPASIASDYTLTLPSAAGTLARTADIPTVTSWENVTTNPTITNAGTIVTQSWKWRRIEDTLHLRGGFVIASTPASELRIGMPDSLTIYHTKIPIVNSNRGVVGMVFWSGNTSGSLQATTDGTNNYMCLGAQNIASGFSASLLTSGFSVGSTVYIDVQIPVSGW